jgi:superfamily I DNA/RNA helicase/RecB family exonuclease
MVDVSHPVPDYRLVRPVRAPAAPPELDAAQRRVVEHGFGQGSSKHGGGPLLVLAGPGTGKTTTLVETVVARVDAGVPIEHILMLTFSRRAAGELRDRVTARLDRTVREPIARTLHSYAFGVLRMHAVAHQLPTPRLLPGAEQDVILRELLAGSAAELWPPALRPALATRGFAGELRDLLMRAVERGLDGPSLAELGRSSDRADWVAAGAFLAEYQDVTSFSRPGGYDPAELIRASVNVFYDDAELLSAERARRRHIFVDEYQDTDPAQAELLALISAGAQELILVGDPDQSIYAFRGADDSAIRDVGRRFGGGAAEVPVIALSQSRRAGPTLLAASRRVADRLPGRAEQRRLVAVDGAPAGDVAVGLFRSASEEAAYLAGVLRRAHLDGLPWSRMAVLVRSTTAVLGTLRRAMITAGVPASVRSEDLPLAEQPAVAVVLEALHCVLRPESLDEDTAERLLLGPIGGGDPVYLRRLRRELRRLAEPGAATLLAPALLDPGVLDPALLGPALLGPALLDPAGAMLLPEHVRWPVSRVARVLAAGRRAVAANSSPEEVLWALWEATGLARRWEQASRGSGSGAAAADRDLDAVVQLFDAAARFTDRLPAASASSFAEHLAAQQIPGDTLATGGSGGEAVSILTAHASKGLEWDLVCVAHVQEGSWPDLRRRGSLLGSELLVDLLAGRQLTGVAPGADQLAEERRLFYVAITRARERLVVTAVAGDEEQPSRFLDEVDPTDEDRPLTTAQRGVHLPGLVAELRAVTCDLLAPGERRQAAAAELARLAGAGVSGADPGTWWGLGELSDDGPVADPDRPVSVSPSRVESFLRCELRTLLQDLGARDGDLVSASLGVLVHDIAATAPPDADLAELERRLDERWSTLDFGAPWFADNERVRARAILARLAQWLLASRAEFTLVGVEEPFSVEIGDAVLRGRVDRLERDHDGRLVVVDLKTGKSKPTKADLPEHPQLAAYQLAVESGAFEAAGARSGGALLVQLAASGDVEQRQGPLADAADPGWIGAQIAAVAARLRGSEFSATANSMCRNCDLRTSCPLQGEGRQVTA